jgi:replicative DNA helicase
MIRSYLVSYQTVSPHATALINVAKGRNIGMFKFIAGFDERTTKFYELTSHPLNTLARTQRADEELF